jgi:hypothetical protein
MEVCPLLVYGIVITCKSFYIFLGAHFPNYFHGFEIRVNFKISTYFYTHMQKKIGGH